MLLMLKVFWCPASWTGKSLLVHSVKHKQKELLSVCLPYLTIFEPLHLQYHTRPH